MSVFKVFFQEDKSEVIVRESTQTKYFEGQTEEEIRKYLTDHNYNIEFVQKLEGAHLDYEKQSDHFKVENI